MALATVLILMSAVAVGLCEGRVQHYKWKVNYQTWAPDCMESTIISINGQFPGPTITAQQGDTIVVELENQMPTENVVIHWHGIRQFGTPWSDGTASVAQCAILAGEKYIYRFVVDQAGTYTYHGHYGMQRTAGLSGSIIVKSVEKEPFDYDGEFSILLNDWWHSSSYEQYVDLNSVPLHWVGDPQSLLIEGRGRFNCSEATTKSGSEERSCNNTNPQCAPHTIKVQQGKTYRLRIGSATSLASLNVAIQGHQMTVVEADGHYVEPFVTDNLDIYSGETYSVLIKADQTPQRNYWLSASVRARKAQTPAGLAILSYVSPKRLPTGSLPVTPAWNDFAYSMKFAQKIKALTNVSSYHRPPAKADRVLKLLNTQNKVDGRTKWAINNISAVLPATPYLAAIKYNISNAFSRVPPPDVYSPADYDIYSPPKNPSATLGDGLYTLEFNSVVDVVLQNANGLVANYSELHPWHLHGHDFWVLGYGNGVFGANGSNANAQLNLENPPLRNTVTLFPWSWALIRFNASNPGVWLFHCHIEAHYFMGMGVVFAEGVDRVGQLPIQSMNCGLFPHRFMRLP